MALSQDFKFLGWSDPSPESGQNNPINWTDFWGLIWITTDVDYHGARNFGRAVLLYIGELINAGQIIAPGPDSFVGATRTLIQKWVSDPENPCENSQYPIGTLRIFSQTYMKHIRGPNDLTNNFPEPFYYQWHPYIPSRTYVEVPSTRY